MTHNEVKIDYEKIGKRIADRRREMGLSQAEFAEMLDISNNYLSAIERGKKHPTLEIWLAVCKGLGVTSDYIFSGASAARRDDSIAERLQSCSAESRELILDIVDVFLKKDNLKRY